MLASQGAPVTASPLPTWQQQRVEMAEAMAILARARQRPEPAITIINGPLHRPSPSPKRQRNPSVRSLLSAALAAGLIVKEIRPDGTIVTADADRNADEAKDARVAARDRIARLKAIKGGRDG